MGVSFFQDPHDRTFLSSNPGRDESQMMPIAASQQAGPEGHSQTSGANYEVNNALWQPLSSYVGLRHMFLLGITCRAWHDCLANAPVDQLPEESRRILLPPGLTSRLPLLELVSRQAQLLAWLRCKHGIFPEIQHLSFERSRTGSNNADVDEAAEADPKDEIIFPETVGSDANDEEDAAAESLDTEKRCTRILDPRSFRELNWSPCLCVEDPSRWLALEPDCGYPGDPMLADLDTLDHQQVTYLDSLSEVFPGTTEPLIFDRPPESQAHWLEDGHCLLVHSPQATQAATTSCCPNYTYKVNACSKTRCLVRLPGANQNGTPHVFAVSNPKIPVTDIFCWLFEHAGSTGVEEQIIAYDLCSCQPLYQVSCPESLLDKCDHIHQAEGSASSGQDTRSSSQMRERRVFLKQLLVAPTKDFLVILWTISCLNNDHPSGEQKERRGLSIHSATTGELYHSRLLRLADPEACSFALDILLMWLPCSHNLMVLDRPHGDLRLITPSGWELWKVSRAERSWDLVTAQASQPVKCSIWTGLGASPCGRWILVTDEVHHNHRHAFMQHGPDGYTGQVSIVETSTSNICFRYTSRKPFTIMEPAWSESGEVCLLQELALVLVMCPRVQPTSQAFHCFELLSIWLGPSLEPPFSRHNNFMGLLPCGSTVIAMRTKDAECSNSTRAQHWQVPSPAALVMDDTVASEGLLPSDCVGLTLDDPDIWRLAWHPLQSACMYVLIDRGRGFHCIDARAGRCVKSWTEAELHDHDLRDQPVDHPNSAADDQSNAGEAHPGYSRLPKALKWSLDGSKLAVASGPRCSVLHFKDMCK